MRNEAQRPISLLGGGIGEKVGRLSIEDTQGRPKQAMSYKEIAH